MAWHNSDICRRWSFNRTSRFVTTEGEIILYHYTMDMGLLYLYYSGGKYRVFANFTLCFFHGLIGRITIFAVNQIGLQYFISLYRPSAVWYTAKNICMFFLAFLIQSSVKAPGIWLFIIDLTLHYISAVKYVQCSSTKRNVTELSSMKQATVEYSLHGLITILA